jgi:DNA helicase HerA-like ATPase
VGRPFHIDYGKLLVMTCDAWKAKANGIPQGTFLLAFYDGESDVEEALLLRAIAPTKLPTDDDNIKSMVAYYKENMEIAGRAGVDSPQSKLDQYTKYEFSFSGLECSVLGVFYRVEERDKDGNINKRIEFGADVENFYSANNYKVYKATEKVLQVIVNQRDGEEIAGNETEFQIGKVRYSSSRRFQKALIDVPVWISPKDFLGKRTALFGMTRTGKSNTVKKIIQATVEISSKAKRNLGNDTREIETIRNARKNNPTQSGLFQQEQNLIQELTKTFGEDGSPKYRVGQIIFDVNGEYANANMQDEGTAIFEIYKDDVVRYSVLEKEGFKVLKINFYSEIESGFDLIKSSFAEEKGDYIKSFTAIDLSKPENYEKQIRDKTSDERLATLAYDRKKALFLCCLYQAKFPVPDNHTRIKFNGCAETLNKLVPDVKPHEGITFDEAVEWFSRIYDESGNIDPQDTNNPFNKYKADKGHDFLDEDMKALLVFLTRKSKPNGTATLSGYRKLRSLIDLHTAVSHQSFETEILRVIREGKIVIVDLSQGNPLIQNLYSQRICRKLFEDSMNNFIQTKPNNFVQFYFEEAHNLFPKKDDKDLTDIYNRIAKEGAKLNLGMVYATQEVSSISSNILKNTQNWFIAHLNNEDELKEIRKYYDFSDFTDSLIRFSASNDKGFVRMKTYTNPFVVPVQIDRFLADRK